MQAPFRVCEVLPGQTVVLQRAPRHTVTGEERPGLDAALVAWRLGADALERRERRACPWPSAGSTTSRPPRRTPISPHGDTLFDRHWISFDADGQRLCEHGAACEALRCRGIEGANLIRPFSREQERLLQVHRERLRR